jgi:hypothetical protein
MLESEKDNIRADFGGFIGSYGGTASSPTNLASFGKHVIGTATSQEKMYVRTTSQFVGAAISIGRFPGMQEAWNNVLYIYASRSKLILGGETAAKTNAVGGAVGYITFTGYGGYNNPLRISLYNYPSDLAKSLFHEVTHGAYPAGTSERFIDRLARGYLYLTGLSGGGCTPRGGLPSCE